jgi:hypothetical protein
MFELPFNELEIENFVLKVSRPRGRRRIQASALGDARRFGGRLFEALFRDQVHTLYRNVLAEARSRDRGVRITLSLNASPELIDIPWEYLFDDPDFLALSMFTPVVRYLDLPRAHRPLLVAPPLRLLGVVSSPAEYERLDVERERENLRTALAPLTQTGAIELHWLQTPSLPGLLRALQMQAFHAFHYIGHGAYDRDAERGVLLFEDDSGWAQPVTGDKLGMVLHDFTSLRLAVLNACEGARSSRTDPFAGVAGSLVQRDIPAVVAMQFEISDEAAIVFANAFYQRLAAGSPVDASLASARIAMLAERSDDIEWGTPVLFMRGAGGRIFDFGQRGEADELAADRHGPTGSGDDTAEHTGLSERPQRRVADAKLPPPPSDHRPDLDPDGSDVRPPDVPSVAGASPARELQERLAAERTGQAHLIYRDADGRQIIRLLAPSESALTIGRGDRCDVSLDSDGEVSRVHAELRLLGRAWTVVDDGLSRNGTFVNGERLQGRRWLRDGDALMVGRTTLVLRSPDRPAGYTTRPSPMPPSVSDADRRLLVALCRPLKQPGQVLPATDQAIADELHMTVPTVNEKLTALLIAFKLDGLPPSDRRVALAVAAMQSGLVVGRDL